MFGTFITFSTPSFNFVPRTETLEYLLLLSFSLCILSVSAEVHVCDLRFLVKPVFYHFWLCCDSGGISPCPLCWSLLTANGLKKGELWSEIWFLGFTGLTGEEGDVAGAIMGLKKPAQPVLFITYIFWLCRSFFACLFFSPFSSLLSSLPGHICCC